MKDNSYDIIGAAIEVHNNLGPILRRAKQCRFALFASLIEND